MASPYGRKPADTALHDILALMDRKVLIQDEGGGRSISYRLATLNDVA